MLKEYDNLYIANTFEDFSANKPEWNCKMYALLILKCWWPKLSHNGRLFYQSRILTKLKFVACRHNEPSSCQKKRQMCVNCRWNLIGSFDRLTQFRQYMRDCGLCCLAAYKTGNWQPERYKLIRIIKPIACSRRRASSTWLGKLLAWLLFWWLLPFAPAIQRVPDSFSKWPRMCLVLDAERTPIRRYNIRSVPIMWVVYSTIILVLYSG